MEKINRRFSLFDLIDKLKEWCSTYDKPIDSLMLVVLTMLALEPILSSPFLELLRCFFAIYRDHLDLLFIAARNVMTTIFNKSYLTDGYRSKRSFVILLFANISLLIRNQFPN